MLPRTDRDEASERMRTYGLAVVARKVDEEDTLPQFVADAERVDIYPIRLNVARVEVAGDNPEDVDAVTAGITQSFLCSFGRAMRPGGFWGSHPAEASASGPRLSDRQP